MPNDTSISRVASEPSTIQRKRSSNESIDLSQLSFFDELLSIGQFIAAPPVQRDEPSPTVDSTAPREEEKKTAPSEESRPSDTSVSPVPTLAQLPTVAQPVATETPPQLDSPKIDRERPDSKRSETLEIKETARKEPSPPKAETDNSAPNVKKGESNGTVSEAPTLSEFETTEPIANEAEQESSSSSVEKPTASLDAKHSLKPVEHSRGSSNAGDARSENDDAPKEDLNAASVQRTLKDEGTFVVSPVFQERSDAKNDEVDVQVPRNKRAERLAKQANESEFASESTSDASTQSTESIPIEDTSSVSTSMENNLSESTLSSGAVPSTSIPIANLPPVPAATFTLSGAANTVVAPRGNGDSGSVAAVSANHGGSASGSTNTTLTGNTVSQSRPDQGRAEVARGSSGTQITAYQEAKLVQRVLRGVEQLANGGGQVRLRLHPPELGSLQMSLRMEAGQVFAKLEVENSTAKDALLNNIQTLKDRMAEQGMKVGAFEVEVSTDSSGSGMGGSNLQSEGGSGGDSRWDNATSRFAQQNSNRLSSEPIPPDRKSGSSWVRTNGSLDLTV